MPGRGRGIGPGRGRGRGPPVARAARRHHAMQQAYAEPAPAPAQKESPPPKEEPKKTEVSYNCEFPRCEHPSEYGFKDEGSYPQFCEEHKSDDMVLLVPDPNNPKKASLERVRQYKKMEPEVDTLKGAPAKAVACQAEIKRLAGAIHQEGEEVQTLTKKIAELDAGLASQEKKPRLKGKTLFGKGLLAQDQGVIDSLTKDKDVKEKRVVEVKGEKEINEVHIKQLKEDLKPLAKDSADYSALVKTMKELKVTAIEAEASGLYLQLKAKGMKKEMKGEGEVIFARLVAKACEETKQDHVTIKDVDNEPASSEPVPTQ